MESNFPRIIYANVNINININIGHNFRKNVEHKGWIWTVARRVEGAQLIWDFVSRTDKT